MPAFCVPAVDVSLNPVALSDDKFYALDYPYPNELVSSAVNVQPVMFRHYRYKEVW